MILELDRNQCGIWCFSVSFSVGMVEFDGADGSSVVEVGNCCLSLSVVGTVDFDVMVSEVVVVGEIGSGGRIGLVKLVVVRWLANGKGLFLEMVK